MISVDSFLLDNDDDGSRFSSELGEAEMSLRVVNGSFEPRDTRAAVVVRKRA